MMELLSLILGRWRVPTILWFTIRLWKIMAWQVMGANHFHFECPLLSRSNQYCIKELRSIFYLILNGCLRVEIRWPKIKLTSSPIGLMMAQKILFGNTPTLSSTQPAWYGVVAYLPDNNNLRVDTARIDDFAFNPFITSADENMVSIYWHGCWSKLYFGKWVDL